jgi:hypothetical protein
MLLEAVAFEPLHRQHAAVLDRFGGGRTDRVAEDGQAAVAFPEAAERFAEVVPGFGKIAAARLRAGRAGQVAPVDAALRQGLDAEQAELYIERRRILGEVLETPAFEPLRAAIVADGIGAYLLGAKRKAEHGQAAVAFPEAQEGIADALTGLFEALNASGCLAHEDRLRPDAELRAVTRQDRLAAVAIDPYGAQSRGQPEIDIARAAQAPQYVKSAAVGQPEAMVDQVAGAMQPAGAGIACKLQLCNQQAEGAVGRFGAQVVIENGRGPPRLLVAVELVFELEVADVLNSGGSGQYKGTDHEIGLLVRAFGELGRAGAAAGGPADFGDPERFAAAVFGNPALGELDPAGNRHVEPLTRVDQARFIRGVVDQPGMDRQRVETVPAGQVDDPIHEVVAPDAVKGVDAAVKHQCLRIGLLDCVVGQAQQHSVCGRVGLRQPGAVLVGLVPDLPGRDPG